MQLRTGLASALLAALLAVPLGSCGNNDAPEAVTETRQREEFGSPYSLEPTAERDLLPESLPKNTMLRTTRERLSVYNDYQEIYEGLDVVKSIQDLCRDAQLRLRLSVGTFTPSSIDELSAYGDMIYGAVNSFKILRDAEILLDMNTSREARDIYNEHEEWVYSGRPVILHMLEYMKEEIDNEADYIRNNNMDGLIASLHDQQATILDLYRIANAAARVTTTSNDRQYYPLEGISESFKSYLDIEEAHIEEFLDILETGNVPLLPDCLYEYSDGTDIFLPACMDKEVPGYMDINYASVGLRDGNLEFVIRVNGNIDPKPGEVFGYFFGLDMDLDPSTGTWYMKPSIIIDHSIQIIYGWKESEWTAGFYSEEFDPVNAASVPSFYLDLSIEGNTIKATCPYELMRRDERGFGWSAFSGIPRMPPDLDRSPQWCDEVPKREWGYFMNPVLKGMK